MKGEREMSKEQIEKEIETLEKRRFLLSMADRWTFDERVRYDELGWQIDDLKKLLIDA